MNRRQGTVSLPLLTSVATGVLTLATLLVVARRLGPEAYAEFAVVWAVFFGVGGALSGLQQEVMRSLLVPVACARGPATPRLVLARALLVTAPVAAAGGAIVIGVTGRIDVAIAVVVGLVGLGAMTTIGGVLSSNGQWRDAAAILVVDAVVRAAVVCGAALLADGTVVELAIVAGALAWTVALVLTPVRAAAKAVSTQAPTDFASRCLTGMVAAGCASLLIAGFPAIVATLSTGDVEDVGSLLAVMVLVRSPLLMIVFAYRPMLLRHLVMVADIRLVTTRLLLVVTAFAVPATGAAAVLGPATVSTLMGSDFEVSGWELAAVTASGVLLVAMVTSGLALVAVDRHRGSTAGWAAALLATAVTIVAAPPGHAEVLIASIVGPAAGLVLHLWLLAGAGQSRPSENADSRS